MCVCVCVVSVHACVCASVCVCDMYTISNTWSKKVKEDLKNKAWIITGLL